MYSSTFIFAKKQYDEAKAAQSKWLDGYQVVISQVLRTYGDATLSHPAASARVEQ